MKEYLLTISKPFWPTETICCNTIRDAKDAIDDYRRDGFTVTCRCRNIAKKYYGEDENGFLYPFYDLERFISNPPRYEVFGVYELNYNVMHVNPNAAWNGLVPVRDPRLRMIVSSSGPMWDPMWHDSFTNMTYLGYVHPVTKKWHSKGFTNRAEAEATIAFFDRKRVPVIDFNLLRDIEVIVHGAPKDVFIESFIETKDKYNISCRDGAKDDPLPLVIKWMIADRTKNGVTVINGKQYDHEVIRALWLTDDMDDAD